MGSLSFVGRILVNVISLWPYVLLVCPTTCLKPETIKAVGLHLFFDCEPQVVFWAPLQYEYKTARASNKRGRLLDCYLRAF